METGRFKVFSYLKSWYEELRMYHRKDGKIVAKEGIEGTKKMLSKLKIITDGILIKLPKRKQDLRMDLPTIGLQTLKDIKKHHLRGVVLKSKKNVFLDKKKVITFANKNKIFINIT